MLFEKLFAHDIISVTPRIVDLEQPIQIVGMGIDTNIEHIPAGLASFAIPCLKYVVFPIRPKNRFGWSIASAKKYIYNIWFPKSEYEPAGVIDDFEYHDERSACKNNPEIDLYVAIRQKHL